jgi:hypothetical protein
LTLEMLAAGVKGLALREINTEQANGPPVTVETINRRAVVGVWLSRAGSYRSRGSA